MASLDCVQGWFKSKWGLRGRSALCLGLGLSLSLIRVEVMVMCHPSHWSTNLTLALVIHLSLSCSPPSCEAWYLFPGLDLFEVSCLQTL